MTLLDLTGNNLVTDSQQSDYSSIAITGFEYHEKEKFIEVQTPSIGKPFTINDPYTDITKFLIPRKIQKKNNWYVKFSELQLMRYKERLLGVLWLSHIKQIEDALVGAQQEFYIASSTRFMYIMIPLRIHKELTLMSKPFEKLEQFKVPTIAFDMPVYYQLEKVLGKIFHFFEYYDVMTEPDMLFTRYCIQFKYPDN